MEKQKSIKSVKKKRSEKDMNRLASFSSIIDGGGSVEQQQQLPEQPKEVMELLNRFEQLQGNPSLLPVLIKCTENFEALPSDEPEKWAPPTSFYLFAYTVTMETGPFRVFGEGDFFCKLHGEKRDSDIIALGPISSNHFYQEKVEIDEHIGGIYAVTIGHTNPNSAIQVSYVTVMDEHEGVLVHLGPDFSSPGGVWLGHEAASDDGVEADNSEEIEMMNSKPPTAVLETVSLEVIRPAAIIREPKLVVGQWNFDTVEQMAQALANFSKWLQKNNATCLHISFNKSLCKAEVFSSVEYESVVDTIQRKHSGIILGWFGMRHYARLTYDHMIKGSIMITARMRSRKPHRAFRLFRAVGLFLWRRAWMAETRRYYCRMLAASVVLSAVVKRTCAVMQLENIKKSVKELEMHARTFLDARLLCVQRESCKVLQAQLRRARCYLMRKKWLDAVAMRREISKKRLEQRGVVMDTMYSEGLSEDDADHDAKSEGLPSTLGSHMVADAPKMHVTDMMNVAVADDHPKTTATTTNDNEDGYDMLVGVEDYAEMEGGIVDDDDSAKVLNDDDGNHIHASSVITTTENGDQYIKLPGLKHRKLNVVQRLLGRPLHADRLEDIVGPRPPSNLPKRKYKWTGYSGLKEAEPVILPPIPKVALPVVNRGGGVYKYIAAPAAIHEPRPLKKYRRHGSGDEAATPRFDNRAIVGLAEQIVNAKKLQVVVDSKNGDNMNVKGAFIGGTFPAAAAAANVDNNNEEHIAAFMLESPGSVILDQI